MVSEMFQITDQGISSSEGYTVFTIDREYLRYSDGQRSLTVPYDVDLDRDVMLIHLSTADQWDDGRERIRVSERAALQKRLTLAYDFIHTQTEFD
jgi:hypothetical protein